MLWELLVNLPSYIKRGTAVKRLHYPRKEPAARRSSRERGWNTVRLLSLSGHAGTAHGHRQLLQGSGPELQTRAAQFLPLPLKGPGRPNGPSSDPSFILILSCFVSYEIGRMVSTQPGQTHGDAHPHPVYLHCRRTSLTKQSRKYKNGIAGL